MNLYRIGYFSPEDSGNVVVLHAEVYTPEQFKALCLSCVPDAYRAELAEVETREAAFVARHPEAACEVPFRRIGFDDLYSRVAGLLVERHGFTVAAFAAEASWFGWADVTERGRWHDYGATNELADTLAAAGIAVRDPDVHPEPATP